MGGLLIPVRCGGCGVLLVKAPRSTLRAPAWTKMFALAASGEVDAWCGPCRDRWGQTPGEWVAGDAGCGGWAAAQYRGRVRRAVLMGKRGAPQAAVQLLIARMQGAAFDWPTPTVVSWVPAHPRRAIGTPDAGRVLAQAVAAWVDAPCQPLLTRSAVGRRQAGLDAARRVWAPERLGFAVCRVRGGGRGAAAAALSGGSVLVVDDVRTSGATLDHVAMLLRTAGAAQVSAIVVASASGGANGQ